MLEKPYIYGELRKIKDKLGFEKFPLITQTYYPSFKNMVISPGFPCVVKVGPFHAGFGKIKVDDQKQFDDVRSLVALGTHYCTAEQFVDWDFDIRVQKIGTNFRVFKRFSPNWKGNVGHSATIKDTEMTPEFQRWIDHASAIFGGMDICALDAVHCKSTGKYYILEINGTAIGLVHRHESEDMLQMRDLVLLELSKLENENISNPILSQENESKSDNGHVKIEEQQMKRIRELENSLNNIQETPNKSGCFIM